MEFEIVSIYGITIMYPKGWWLYPNPKVFSPKEGSIAVRPQDKEISVAIIWYDLKEEKDRSFEEYFQSIVSEFQRHFSDFQLIKKEKKKINGHECLFLHVKYNSKIRRFSRKKKAYERIHYIIKCNISEKFIIFYVTAPPEIFNQEKTTIEEIVKSFKCH
jgi:hypothetical protein